MEKGDIPEVLAKTLDVLAEKFGGTAAMVADDVARYVAAEAAASLVARAIVLAACISAGVLGIPRLLRIRELPEGRLWLAVAVGVLSLFGACASVNLVSKDIAAVVAPRGATIVRALTGGFSQVSEAHGNVQK